MLTQKRYAEDLRPVEGLDWSTALRAPQIQKLAPAGTLPKSPWDKGHLAEIALSNHPGRRADCVPQPAVDRGASAQAAGVARGGGAEFGPERGCHPAPRPRGQEPGADSLPGGLGTGWLEGGGTPLVGDSLGGIPLPSSAGAYAKDAAPDGTYVVRSAVLEQRLGAEQTVRTHKRLATLERALRSLEIVDFEVRPIRHGLPDRVRAQVLTCLPACYVT